MEDHIIAAHCALVIGYMIINDNYINMREVIDVDAVKSKMKDNSFQFMVKVIRKFIVFMRIMVRHFRYNLKIWKFKKQNRSIYMFSIIYLTESDWFFRRRAHWEHYQFHEQARQLD
jgi:hypothetical protein